MSMFQFGNVVVVDGDQIGLIVKTWGDDTYEVYVRNYNGIKTYTTKDIQRFIYSKELSDEEIDFYKYIERRTGE